jgi:hypothetical protein
MNELDQLAADLLAAADTWFSQALHLKLQRLIEIAKTAERHAAKVRSLTILLDGQLGTPCEQIRHRQEIEALQTRIAELQGDAIRL